MSWNIIICYCDRRVYCNQITLNLQFYYLLLFFFLVLLLFRCSHWKRKIEEKNNDLQHSNWKKRIVIFYCVSIFHPSYQLKSSLCRSEYFLIVFRLAHNFASASQINCFICCTQLIAMALEEFTGLAIWNGPWSLSGITCAGLWKSSLSETTVTVIHWVLRRQNSLMSLIVIYLMCYLMYFSYRSVSIIGNFNIVVKYGACALLSGDCDNFVSTGICKSEDQKH